jgi:hypothetical protein
MAVNKFRLPIQNRDLELVLPIEQIWDFSGEQQAIEQYELSILEDILNKDEDFEVTRFEHKLYGSNQSSANYEFYLWDTALLNYQNSYLSKFDTSVIYYYANPFTKSFWKLDLYDSPQLRDQQPYITIILPVQQGGLESAILNSTTNVEIKKPLYSLDYIGDKEGFFIYWLKKRNFLNIDTFYMTAKFFNGGTGQFTKMMTVPQTSLSSQYDFPPDEYFYYKVQLDYPSQTYELFTYPGLIKAGTTTNPIKWYEYLNP